MLVLQLGGAPGHRLTGCKLASPYENVVARREKSVGYDVEPKASVSGHVVARYVILPDNL